MADTDPQSEYEQAMAERRAEINAVASQLDRPTVPEGLVAHFSCEHGQSNTPCLCHYATAMLTGQPLPTTQPDNWHELVPAGSGFTDAADITPI